MCMCDCCLSQRVWLRYTPLCLLFPALELFCRSDRLTLCFRANARSAVFRSKHTCTGTRTTPFESSRLLFARLHLLLFSSPSHPLPSTSPLSISSCLGLTRPPSRSYSHRSPWASSPFTSWLTLASVQTRRCWIHLDTFCFCSICPDLDLVEELLHPLPITPGAASSRTQAKHTTYQQSVQARLHLATVLAIKPLHPLRTLGHTFRHTRAS